MAISTAAAELNELFCVTVSGRPMFRAQRFFPVSCNPVLNVQQKRSKSIVVLVELEDDGINERSVALLLFRVGLCRREVVVPVD